MDYTVLIPARLASTRLPGKPLADIAGRPMVVRVAQRALESGASRVVVAADSAAIVQACASPRMSQACAKRSLPDGWSARVSTASTPWLAPQQLVVNVQGDEPLIAPSLIDAVAALLARQPQADMSTAAHPIDEWVDFVNPNVVKTVLDARGMALYFSRAPIPCWRDGPGGTAAVLPIPAPLRHIGIYGYRVAFLRRFPTLPQAPVEICEALEQLRALWHGHRIAVHVTDQAPGPGVDTPADLERVRKLF